MITDVTAPVPEVETLADVTDECSVTTLTAPTATDNCGGTLTVTNNAYTAHHNSRNNSITWTYDDGNGNTSTQNSKCGD